MAAVMSCTLGVAACEAEDKKAAETKAPEAASAEAEKAPAAEPAEEAKAPEAAPAEETKVAEAKPEPAPAAAPAEEAKAPKAAPAPAEETKVAEAAPAAAEGGAKGGGTKDEEGKYRLPDGTLTYNVAADGTVDWYTYSGYKRYHSECHVCHGPGGDGSTFAPALRDSLKKMDYQAFVTVVMSGRERDVAGTKYIMPALGDNKNVACFIDDLYAYIKARSDDAVPFGRPPKREDKPQAAKDYEDACFGS